MTVIVCILHLLAAGFVPAERSKGDVIHTRKAKARGKASADAESYTSVGFAQELNKQVPYRHVDKAEVVSSHEVSLKHSSILHWNDLSYDVPISHGQRKRILDWVVKYAICDTAETQPVRETLKKAAQTLPPVK
ncbi:hypothetical protein F5Y14DRAFT_186643 [Nemania sp. NC0429]|nr:hypothetical protein F5Y14DRAFT_186643 [Nemania sp. NC0429]